MNENINLIEIFKDVPIGTQFWSPICGILEFVAIERIDGYDAIIAHARDNRVLVFNRKGHHIHRECSIFPSEELTDWEAFNVYEATYQFKPFEKVLVRDYETENWRASIYSHMENNKHVTNSGIWQYCIPYEGNEHLVGKANNSNGI